MRLTAVNYFDDAARGWAPIEHMVGLCARLFGVDVARAPAVTRVSKLRKLGLMAFPTARDDAACEIYVARFPDDVVRFIDQPGFHRPGRRRVLWMIDSYLTGWLPPTPLLRKFDVVGFTQHQDAELFRDRLGDRALWLGWGADALDGGSACGRRPVDVLRVGRQPEAWDDDDATAEACRREGLSFAGRPPGDGPPDAAAHLRLSKDHYSQAKFVLASSNLVGPRNYTSATREYITARWTDALACGATVAGVPPRSDLALLDWPEALLDFGTIDFQANMAMLREATAQWTPEVAKRNHLGALRRLDWRWRFKAIADKLGLVSPTLEAEIARLRARIAELEAELAPPAGAVSTPGR